MKPGNLSRFAHSLPNAPDQSKWEPLGAHLNAVRTKASEFAAAFGFAKWGEAAGLLHDIGKVSEAFQAYIRGAGGSPDHSTAGAVEALRRYGDTCGRLLALMVAGHHAGLADGKDLSVRLTKVLAHYDGWEDYTGPLPALTDLSPPSWFTKNQQYPGFENAFLTRMIFSCLVDADFLETERFYASARDEMVVRGNDLPLAALRDRLRAAMANKAASAENTTLGHVLIKRFPIRRDCDSSSMEVFDDDSALRDFGF